MKEVDQLTTSFITPFGAYCYVTMPFGLKNAGATYQRCMNRCLGELVGDIVEVYIDDIVVKSRKADQLVGNVEAAFTRLREFRIKLNPEKCIFGIPKGKLLVFIIFERGIKANPEKITTIKNLSPITNLKGVQKLMGCLASLSRFISRLGEHGMPLYRLLKKADQFTWTTKAQEAFEKLKAFLAMTPRWYRPRMGNRSFSTLL